MMRVKLGEIATLINGDRGKNYPSQNDISKSGDIPFINAGHLNGRDIVFDDMNFISQDRYDKLSSGKFIAGDILYCLRGSLGKKAIVGDDLYGAIASSLVIIRPSDSVRKDYLMFALDSPAIIDQQLRANNGSSQPNLSAANVKAYELDLPDIKTQEAIAEKLTKVRTVVVTRQKQLEQLDKLVKARFVEMFGGPVSNPCFWDKMALKNICVKLTDGTHFSPESFEEGEYKYITAKNIKINGFDFTNISYVSEEVHRPIFARCNPEKGDVLYIKDGVTTGIAMVNTLEEEFSLLSSVALLKQDRAIINGHFLCGVLNNAEMYADIRRNMGGAAITRLTIAKLNEMQVVVPPLELQNQFADFVAQVDKSKVAVQKSLDEAQLLFDSLMQKYFGRGEK